MPKPESAGPGRILQLKIALVGARPPIWRRVLVPAKFSLAQLHDVIQAAMGWEDAHLHQFRTSKAHRAEPIAEEALLGQALSRTGGTMLYHYDFGDDWLHQIRVEKVLPTGAGARYPVCTAGKGACPPEDCGGIGGYERLLEILSDPEDPEYEDMIEWVGVPLDPTYFSVEEANLALAHLQSSSSGSGERMRRS